jgi:phage repressor protein C with HTH and peptisase S24 domain
MSLKDNLIRLRRARGMSQQRLARASGVRQNTIAAIESGRTQRTRFAAEIARALNVSVTQLVPDELASSVVPLSDSLVGTLDLPVYGTVEAGAGAVVIINEPVDRVGRPAPLLHVRDGYGVIVHGDSMTPLIRPGDIVLVHPHLPPRPEDWCVFRRSLDGEFSATIKEYGGQTATAWRVKRYQPREEHFSLKKADWPECHVIVGKYNRR